MLPALQVGIVLGWTSTSLPYLVSEESSIPVTEDEGSWITSLIAIGGLIGSLPAGKLADMIGRKKSLQFSCLFYLLSWAGLIVASEVWMLYLARTLGGIGAGSTCVLSLMYVGEIAEKSVRGKLASSFAVLLSLGLLSTYSLGWIMSIEGFAWLCIGSVIIFIGLSFLLVESPEWLMSRNREIEARESLFKLRGNNFQVCKELNDIRGQIFDQKTKPGGLKYLAKTPAGRKAMIVGFGLMMFQQLSGIDAVLAYTVTIFQAAGGSVEPFLATVIIGVVQIVASMLATVVIEKFGRRPLLIVSGSSMTVILMIFGGYFRLKKTGFDMAGFGWLPLTALILYNIVFPIGFGSISWAMISEIFTAETRAVASGISLAVNWGFVFLVRQFYPAMVANLDESITFWIFAGIMFCATIFAVFIVPETKGKSIDDIQRELAGEIRNKEENNSEESEH